VIRDARAGTARGATRHFRLRRWELEARGVDELGQLNAVVPNVSMYGGFATGEAQGSFRMRGVPGVATYVDGVWLFGKNAVGGAIQYVTDFDAADISFVERDFRSKGPLGCATLG
jgi:hypothetical protein